MADKIHWTQTEEGRKRMSALAKKKHANGGWKAARKSTKKGARRGQAHTKEVSAHEDHTSYIFGKVETILEYYSRSNGVPYSTLAEGVAALLRRSAGR